MRMCFYCGTELTEKINEDKEYCFCENCFSKMKVFDTKEIGILANDILNFSDKCNYSIPKIQLIRAILETKDNDSNKIIAIDKVANNKTIRPIDLL